MNTAAAPTTRSYVRGSGMLLGGRCVALAINCLVQILIVRYLSKGDYGAFAYGLATLTLLSTTILCGLGKALPRVVSIDHEKQDYPRAFGNIVVAAAFVVSLGSLAAVLFRIFDAELRALVQLPPGVLPVLLILVAAVPVDALDHLMQHLAAIFCGPRAIFLRRHVAGPSLKLGAVFLVIAFSGSVTQLAFGFVAASLIGVSLYMAALLNQWHRRGLLQYLRPSRLRLPIRELFAFSLPLAASDVAVAVRGSLAVFLLGAMGTIGDVADYRAVLPLAGLNMVAADTFALLFVPMAARLFARGDGAAINALYWQSSIWIAVLTLPVFVMTFALAPPLVTFVFGPDYADAAPILAVLSIGYYFNAAVGFNAAMLRVTGRLAIIVRNDLIAVVACVALTALLIGQFGAIGAAAGTSATFIIHNLLNYSELSRRHGAVLQLDAAVMRLYGCIGLAAFGVIAATVALDPSLLFGAGFAAVATAIVVRLARGVLNVHGTFPELQRVPVLRRLFG